MPYHAIPSNHNNKGWNFSLRDSSYSNVQPDQPVDDGHYFSWARKSSRNSADVLDNDLPSIVRHLQTPPVGQGTLGAWGKDPSETRFGHFKLWLPTSTSRAPTSTLEALKSAELGDMAVIVIHLALLLTHQPPQHILIQMFYGINWQTHYHQHWIGEILENCQLHVFSCFSECEQEP